MDFPLALVFYLGISVPHTEFPGAKVCFLLDFSEESGKSKNFRVAEWGVRGGGDEGVPEKQSSNSQRVDSRFKFANYRL